MSSCFAGIIESLVIRRTLPRPSQGRREKEAPSRALARTTWTCAIWAVGLFRRKMKWFRGTAWRGYANPSRAEPRTWGWSPRTDRICSCKELFPQPPPASRHLHDSDHSRTICSGRVFCSRFCPSGSRSAAAQGSAQPAGSRGPASSPGGAPAERGGKLSQRSTW